MIIEKMAESRVAPTATYRDSLPAAEETGCQWWLADNITLADKIRWHYRFCKIQWAHGIAVIYIIAVIIIMYNSASLTEHQYTKK